MKKKYFNWDDIRTLSHLLANQIASIPQSMPRKKTLFIYGVPRGGVYIALSLVHSFSYTDITVALTSNPDIANIIVDDIIDTGKTKEYYQKKYPQKLFVALVDKKSFPNEWVVFPWEEANNELGPEENIVRILEYIGEDPKREGLVETPKRIIKSYDKLFGGYKQDPKDVLKIFTEGACDEMVLVKNLEFYSTCEHHMLPFYGKAHIAYIPNNNVIGVSKLGRLLEIYSRRLQIQERICQQVTGALMDLLKPKGAACILEAKHLCMTARGIEKQDSTMVTSSLTGLFLTDQNTRTELLNLIK